ncbi:hypothetical protein V5O48_016043 [Marasmius crinis-equi]|uniref:Uncharacterized protein n=1 Tax=Marasmius crinis-equi TaxID=585013 RepID=A0ABR3ESW4_9AGAR
MAQPRFPVAPVLTPERISLQMANWDQAATDDQFLYALFLAEDTNFKQKARAQPNDDRDPPLGSGWGVFVPNDVYMEELGK